MLPNGCLKRIVFAAAATLAGASLSAASFGTVVPIAGHASDIALDEARGWLYIANFTANRIEEMSLADNTIHTSMNVAAQPGALAMSRDGHFLVVAHYGNWVPSDPTRNLITSIDLTTGARQTFVLGDAPLGVAFIQTGQALIVTATSFVLFDPATSTTQTVTTFASLADQALPVTSPTFPPQILEAALTADAAGQFVWGIGSAGTGAQVVFRYNAALNTVQALAAQSSPPLLPRVSVSSDGSQAMIGYALFGANFQRGVVLAQYPDVLPSLTVTGSAIDAANGIIYAQIPDRTQPTGPPFPTGVSPAGGSSIPLPTLYIMDADNLTVRDRIGIPEDMVGRALLRSDRNTLYAVSDSGAMVLPVGALNQYPRVAAGQEDLLVQAQFCSRGALSQSLTISDPGGGHTDFTVNVSQAGVSVSPASGVTPATVQVLVDPTAFQNQSGTTAIALTITSRSAINIPRPVRLLVNNPSPDQRGTIIDVPGHLTDLLTDTLRNRIYILRQDANELLIYDGAAYSPVAALRTAATPVRMALTTDLKYAIVVHENAQLAYVYNLDTLQREASIPLPFGHYARSLAGSNAAMLAVARNGNANSATGGVSGWVGVVAGPTVVDTIDFNNRVATALPSLGIWVNTVSADAALAPAPNGATILLAGSDGDVMLYSAVTDTFVAQRKDFSALGGAFAASGYSSYVVGSAILDASLVPTGSFDGSNGASSGFAFVNQGGFRTTGSSASGPGTIQNLATLQNAASQPFRVVEAPVMPTTGLAFTRTVAPLAPGTSVISLSASGFTVLPWSFDAAVAPPLITSLVNAADGTLPVAPGGLISIYGQQMSPVNLATNQIPLPTAIARSCVTVNGSPVPLLYVSDTQINAQLPNNVSGSAVLTIDTPGGISNNYNFTVYANAPSIFLSGTAGPLTGLATVVRWNNGELVTPTNPIHPNDYLEIYLTGMGATTPPVAAGQAAPSSPLALVTVQPALTLGGYPLPVLYAGLAPGWAGVYQIDVQVPFGVPLGMTVPLAIVQGGRSTNVDERVVK
ncbi:MAG: IPT/TIG domain-containing protein [Bryobacteraceae bacterium]|jgi:uncharacterized protein (TIGR03437 family)